MQALAARHPGFDADHPEGLRADQQRSQAAGDPLLAEGETAGAEADGEDSVERGAAQVAGAGEAGSGQARADQQDAAGERIAQAHQQGRGEGFERDADT